MKISVYIRDKINKLPKGYVFTYTDFSTEVNDKEAVIKHLNRMVAAGNINKLSKGKYYKPKETVFGTLQPNQYQIVKDLLEDEGKIIGYLTGYSIYNSLGLTTQVSNRIQIGKNEIRPAFKRERFKISFIKQKNTITRENVPLLQILDAIRYIKKIPDTTIDKSCIRITSLLSDLKNYEKQRLIKLAAKYPPSTRALVGALLDRIGYSDKDILNTLFETLNPISTYKLNVSKEILPNAENWNIK
ncbi:MAG: DUF6088 family protein [Bacteroidota bacterium]|nr:DUF6088 family protein [Bacteroidota bacterium]